MADPLPTIAETNLALLADHFDQGMSHEELKEKYGRSLTTIKRLIRDEKARGRKYTKAVKSSAAQRDQANMRARSPPHSRIGVAVYTLRTAVLGLSVLEAARAWRMTHQLVRKIELGAHAITLDQIQFFAREMGLEAWELIHPNGRTPQRPAKPTRAHS